MNNTTTIRLMAPLAVGAALVWFLGYPGAEGRWLSIALFWPFVLSAPYALATLLKSSASS